MKKWMNVLRVGGLGVLIAMSIASVAEAKSCAELTDDLRAMQKAQASLLDSMVRKNGAMASTLDQYAQNFSKKRNLRKADLIGMKRSAQAFRSHEAREEKLVRRFQAKTDELLTLVEECLKAKTIAQSR